MWEVVLLSILFDRGKFVQVAEPYPDTRFETIAVCQEYAAKAMKHPLPAGWVAVLVCVDPLTQAAEFHNI